VSRPRQLRQFGRSGTPSETVSLAEGLTFAICRIAPVGKPGMTALREQCSTGLDTVATVPRGRLLREAGRARVQRDRMRFVGDCSPRDICRGVRGGEGTEHRSEPSCWSWGRRVRDLRQPARLTGALDSCQIRPTLEGENRCRHFARKTPSSKSIVFGGRPRFGPRRYADRRPRGQRKSTPGSHFVYSPGSARTTPMPRSGSLGPAGT
jgi:hypothetical protein